MTAPAINISKPRRKLNRKAPSLMRLEPRIMFDGAAVDTAMATLTTATADAASVDQYIVPPATEASAPREIAFVDAMVADSQALLAGIRPGVEVVLVQAGENGLEKMLATLQGQQNISTIHILGHGAQGMAMLGNSALNSASLVSLTSQLSLLGSTLTASGDILLYGCNIAQGQEGVDFVNRLSQITGADVAASTDNTGAEAMGGDWSLEYASGTIDASALLTTQGVQSYANLLSTIDLSGKTGWTAIMFGTGKDPQGDSQAGAADTDIIGDATHGSLYTAYDDNGTLTTADDTLVFRLRIDNPTSTSNFAGVAIVGMDANLDGKIDVFFSVDGRNNSQSIKILDPGTGENFSPSTTTTSPLPTGWLPNNGVYAFSASNYSVVAVSATSDANWGASAMNPATGSANDLSAAGGIDAFISWKIPIADIATVLAKPSPVDRNGIYGPRGATGIAGYTKDTVVQYVSFTQTQPGPINGDLNGVSGSYDKNATFASLGTFTSPMSASNPVPASTSLSISDNVSGTANGNVTFTFTFSEAVTGFDVSDISVTGGTKGTFSTVNGSTYTLVVAPDNGVDSGTIEVNVASGAGQSVAASLPTAAASATQAYDTLAPVITIDTLATALSGKPTLSGTTDLPDGSLITVTVDPDNNAGTTNLIYQVMVSGGIWTLNTNTVTPVSGSMPSGGLTSYTKVTATATDAAGNSSTATELNRPTVNTLSTNNTTPTLSGTWTNIGGDTLTVTVSGATYTLSPSGNTWSLNLASATPSSGSLTALVVGNTYDVTATVTRSGVPVSDTTSGELAITNTPVATVDITGGATASASDTTPAITGTSQNAGGFVIVRLDPGNDGDLSDAVTYSVTPAGDGSWSLDTGTAQPISGQTPGGGFIGTVGVLATNATGSVSDAQVLTVSTPSITIDAAGMDVSNHGIYSASSTDSSATVDNTTASGKMYLNMTEDNSVTITGTAAGASTVDVTITDINSHTITVSGVTVSSGRWSASGIDLSSLDDGLLTVTASISGTSVTATNTEVTHDKTAPVTDITAQDPLKKTAAVITGKTDLSDGTLLTIEIYDGATLKAQWTSISVSSGSFTTSGVSPNSGSANIGNGGPFTINVYPTSTATDTAGNISQTVTETRAGQPNSSTNSITIGAFASGDGINTLTEISDGVAISGTTTLTGTPTVSITVTDSTGHTVSLSTAAASSAWSATLTNAQIKTLANGVLTITASTTETVSGVTYTISDTIFSSLTVPSPTLTISDDTPGTATGDVTYTFTFSEAVTDFTASDISVTNGTKGALSGSGTTYTMVISPTAASSGNMLVSVNDSVATSSSTGRGNVGDSDTQAFVTTGAAAAPTITIDTSGLASSTTPTITGTTSLSAGAPVVIEIDTNNDGTVDLRYSATVQVGGTWSLDISTATPTFGTLPDTGLPGYAEVVATATNAYNNSTSVTGLNNPAVTSLSSNDSTPTISGYWTQVAGDTLEVVVNGVTYSVANGNLTVGATTWSLTPAIALADNTYEVAATVSRSGGGSASDTTSNELLIDTSASVTISGGVATATSGDATPVIAGVSSDLPAGTVLTLSLDIDNNGSTDVVYKTTIAGDGSWSVNTASAVPYSGSFPAGGLNGDVLLTATATDPAGNTGSDTQVLAVDVTPPAISLTFNAKTADTTPVIMGTTDLSAGSTITVEIDPNNDGDWSDVQTYSATVQSDGSWSVEATVPLSGTVGVRASGTDDAGNSVTTATKSLQITNLAPGIAVTTPIAGDNTADASEDDALVLVGTTANVTAGSKITLTITDGSITITDTATVQNDGSWGLAALNLSAMASGILSVTAEVIDTDGSAYHDIAQFTHDKSATVAIDSISNDTGTIGDFITRDNTVAISGTATANTAVTVVIKDSGNNSVQTFNVSSDGSGAWYTPASPGLAAGDYAVFATVGGTTVSHALSIVDVTAPSLTSSTPLDNATSVSVSNNIALTFSKNIQAGSGFISLYKNDGTLIENFNVATGLGDAGGSVAFDGTTGVTLNPSADLLASTDYYLKVGSSAVMDSAGNTFAGINDATTLNFTTAGGGGDTTAPAVPGVDLLASSDNGSSQTDDITNDTTPTIRVTLNGAGATAPLSGDVVKLYQGATQVGTATLNVTDISNGYVDITSSVLSAGSLSFTATVTDAANNVSNASVALPVTLDTTMPTLAMQGVPAAHNGASFTVTLEFSENVSGFTVGDITVSGATLSGFNAVDGNTYTVVVNPSGSSDITLDIASALAQDTAGNGNAAATQASITYSAVDNTPPTIAISSDKNSLKAGETAMLTFTLSENPGSNLFNASDITVSGGTLSNFSGSGMAYTATFTPTANSTAAGVISVGNARFNDGAGNDNADGADVNNTVTITVDTAPPAAPGVASLNTSSTTPTITGTANLGAGETLTVTVNGITYTVGGNLSLSGNTWTLAIPAGDALIAGNVYSVTATVNDAAGNATSDPTSGELVIGGIQPPPPLEPPGTPPTTIEPPPPSDTTQDSGGTTSTSGGTGTVPVPTVIDPITDTDVLNPTLAGTTDGTQATTPTSATGAVQLELGATASEGQLATPRFVVRVDDSIRAGSEHVLRVDKAIPEQRYESSGTLIKYIVPSDAFVHTDVNAQVTLFAVMIDGTPLPSWLTFDPVKGEFKGMPPNHFTGELTIKVIARDDAGRQAETIVRIRVGEAVDRISLRGKPSLSAQFGASDLKSWKSERDKLIEQARRSTLKARASRVA